MLLLMTMLAFNSAQLTAEQVVQSVVEERVLKAWEGEHALFVDFAYREIPTTGAISAKVGPGVYFNSAYPWNWLMHGSGYSYIEVNPTLTKEEAQKKWTLGLSHLSSKPGYSPVSIEVNGTMIENHFLPLVDAWRQDFFPVALHEGKNSIVISLLGDAHTNYWIEKLWLDPVAE